MRIVTSNADGEGVVEVDVTIPPGASVSEARAAIAAAADDAAGAPA